MQIVYLGKIIAEVTELTYDVETEKEHIYGAGSDPYAIQSGNKKPTGQLSLLQSGYDALQEAAKLANPGNPYADVTDIAFDIVVTYSNDIKHTTDILKSVEITKLGKGMKQGDKRMEVNLPFLFLGLIQNA